MCVHLLFSSRVHFVRGTKMYNGNTAVTFADTKQGNVTNATVSRNTQMCESARKISGRVMKNRNHVLYAHKALPDITCMLNKEERVGKANDDNLSLF